MITSIRVASNKKTRKKTQALSVRYSVKLAHSENANSSSKSPTCLRFASFWGQSIGKVTKTALSLALSGFILACTATPGRQPDIATDVVAEQRGIDVPTAREVGVFEPTVATAISRTRPREWLFFLSELADSDSPPPVYEAMVDAAANWPRSQGPYGVQSVCVRPNARLWQAHAQVMSDVAEYLSERALVRYVFGECGATDVPLYVLAVESGEGQWAYDGAAKIALCCWLPIHSMLPSGPGWAFWSGLMDRHVAELNWVTDTLSLDEVVESEIHRRVSIRGSRFDGLDGYLQVSDADELLRAVCLVPAFVLDVSGRRVAEDVAACLISTVSVFDDSIPLTVPDSPAVLVRVDGSGRVSVAREVESLLRQSANRG